MPTHPSAPDPGAPDTPETTRAIDDTTRATDDTTSTTGPSTADADREPTLIERLGADWAAVIIAGALVVLAGLGLLPSIPFLIK